MGATEFPGWLSAACAVPSERHALLATERQAQLTKPAGALGRLEALAIELAGLQKTERPRAGRVAVVLFAGDHGIAVRGVSAYPSSVTVQMLRNFAGGGAAISVLTRHLGASLTVADVGTTAVEPVAGIVTRKVRRGTRDFLDGPAMESGERDQTLEAGREIAAEAFTGADVVVFGEMGIGNTTSAAALAAAVLGCSAAEVTGRGTGLDDARLAAKIGIIDAGLRRHGFDTGSTCPLSALGAVGGFEIAALVGAIIAAAQSGVPVIVDGFIVTVAALIAVRINFGVRPWLIFSHASAEQGHARVLTALAAKPLLDLGLRLGEGSGAVLAVGLLRAALAVHNDMATFAEAGVTDRAP